MDGAALIVGIDEYPKSQSLTGCIDDAKHMTERLERHAGGQVNFDCETHLGDRKATVTRALLRGRLTYLLQRRVSHAVFYFSGHAAIRQSTGLLVTQDGQQWEEGLSMTELIDMANWSKIPDVTLIIDSCYGGHLGEGSDSSVRLREGVTILAAASGDDEALSGRRGSLFTDLICEALDGAAADLRGRVTVASVYNYLDSMLGGMAQRPVLRANLSRLLTLRQCAPRVSDEDLRLYLSRFPSADHEPPLDPEHEPLPPQTPNYKPSAKKVDDMKGYRTLLKAGLLEPRGASYLWDAAMGKKSCGLTATGKYYWEMVKKKKI